MLLTLSKACAIMDFIKKAHCFLLKVSLEGRKFFRDDENKSGCTGKA